MQTVKSTEGPIFKGVNFVVVEGAEKTNSDLFHKQNTTWENYLQEVDRSEISESILTNTLDFVGIHQQ